jgi:hypothetical protein
MSKPACRPAAKPSACPSSRLVAIKVNRLPVEGGPSMSDVNKALDKLLAEQPGRPVSIVPGIAALRAIGAEDGLRSLIGVDRARLGRRGDAAVRRGGRHLRLVDRPRIRQRPFHQGALRQPGRQGQAAG